MNARVSLQQRIDEATEGLSARDLAAVKRYLTAAIDAVTERRVREALAEATATKATIVIAHRLSSLMHADQIIVLDEGRIVERGRHAELVAAAGIYADLYDLQTRTDAEAVLDETAA